MVLTAANCGDDDCPSCPAEPVSPGLYAIGKVAIDDDLLSAYIDIYDVNGTGDKVDSASVDGEFEHWCITDYAHTVANDGRQVIASYGTPPCLSGAVWPINLGETSEITLYCRRVAHRVQLHLLDVDGSRPGNLQANVDEPSNRYQLSWNAVADAEWYAVKMRYKFISGPGYKWDYFCLDSTRVDEPLLIPYQGLYDLRIYVAAGIGPMPTREHPTNNISGDHITGSIYSVSSDAYAELILNPFNGTHIPAEPVTPPSIAELIRREGPALSRGVTYK